VIHASERGARGRSYVLVTPANHYASRLAELPGAVVVKLVTPRVGPARFGQYLVELAAGAGTAGPVGGGFEHFVFGLDGVTRVVAGGRAHDLAPGGFAYVPEGAGLELRPTGDAPARVLWLKRRYERIAGLDAPGAITGHRDAIAADRLPVHGLTRQELLLPGDPAFDFNMSLLRFAPGASLDRAEIHDEEHGLYMTAGEGIYLLDRDRHEVREGDFIYMAPYCPQSFASTGTGPAEYLLYKDVYRDGF
jgi:(S)-ureidoglycine aminohydrolase